MQVRATLFPSPLGCCAIAWRESGAICGLQLPRDSDAATLETLAAKARCSTRACQPPPHVRAVVARAQRHLDGTPDRRGFTDVPLEHTSPPFARDVYDAARAVPPGQTTTYGELARALGRPGSARAVGQALGRNPIPLLVPCHRVLAAGGDLGGFSAHGGLATKLRLLTLEGADRGPMARAGTRRLRRADPDLARVIERVGPYPLVERGPRADPFAVLVKSIIHQQLSVKAGATVHRRLLQLVGRITPAQLLRHDARQLRSAGISRQKAAYLHDLAWQASRGELPLRRLQRMDDRTVIQQLTRVKGIGTWSVQMLLIFHLGRLDVLPVDDLGLRRGAQRLYGLDRPPDAPRLRELGQRWAPFRSIASWYLWRVLDAGGLA